MRKERNDEWDFILRWSNTMPALPLLVSRFALWDVIFLFVGKHGLCYICS